GEILGRHPASALSPTSFAIHHLGIDATHLASTKYSGPGTSLAILGNHLRIELERHADAVIIGSPGDGQPPTWSQLDIGGDDKVAVPGRVIASELIAGDPANRYTTILADANTMRHMIAELYASSETFGPTLVVLDDIDLVLGHRLHPAAPARGLPGADRRGDRDLRHGRCEAAGRAFPKRVRQSVVTAGASWPGWARGHDR
ncbi:MAG: hypothetical protein ACKOHK_08160, partial [Planctomycetia bacterium]